MSYVAIERNQCPICGELHTHNTALLLDKRLKEDRFEDGPDNGPVTGWGLCEKHAKLHEDGFICLIELDMTNPPEGMTMNLENTWPMRTGNHVHIRANVARELLNMTEDHAKLEFSFCDNELIGKLQEIQNGAE